MVNCNMTIWFCVRCERWHIIIISKVSNWAHYSSEESLLSHTEKTLEITQSFDKKKLIILDAIEKFDSNFPGIQTGEIQFREHGKKRRLWFCAIFFHGGVQTVDEEYLM